MPINFDNDYTGTGRICFNCNTEELWNPYSTARRHRTVVTTYGMRICEDCVRSLEYVKCVRCGKYHPKSSALYEEEYNRYWCPQCAHDYGVITCPDCGRITSDRSIVRLADGSQKTICMHCAELYPRYCACCGDRMQDDAIGLSMDLRNGHGDLCVTCAETRTLCYHCGSAIMLNQYTDQVDAHGHRVCSYCFEHMQPRAINDYNYKPYPLFYGIVDRNNHPYMGIELEVDKGYDNPKRCARDIASIGNKDAEHVYCKHDGSLDDGVEIVSHPATLAYHMTKLPWMEIQDACRNHGFKSHDAYTCGLHVHVNRDYFSKTSKTKQDLDIAKILLMVDRFWDELVIFSRRDYSQLEHWAQKPSLDAVNDSDETLLRKVEDKRRYAGRYQAVNIQNTATIEFRLFRGTLNVKTLFATLQLVETICHYAKYHDLRNIQTMSWNDLIDSSPAYTEMQEYITRRGLRNNRGNN